MRDLSSEKNVWPSLRCADKSLASSCLPAAKWVRSEFIDRIFSFGARLKA